MKVKVVKGRADFELHGQGKKMTASRALFCCASLAQQPRTCVKVMSGITGLRFCASGKTSNTMGTLSCQKN